MRVVIFGSTGMVGSGVVTECLADPGVGSVLTLVRAGTGREHAKLREVVHPDFFDYANLADALTGLDACFFCLGVSAAGMSEERYTRLTYDLTVAAAEALLIRSPNLAFCYVSGAGTDPSGQSRFMWARVKGRTENRLLEMPFRAAYMFRPGYIQPAEGVRSKTTLYRAAYAVVRPLYPLIRRLAPDSVTTTEIVGRAMIAAAIDGYSKPVVEVADINALGGDPR